MQAIEAGEVEWTAYIEGNIKFHQPDAIKTETKLIRDVLEAGEDKKLKEFILTFNKLNLVYGVDLKTGEFIIGGLKHDLAPEVPKCNLRLIYYIRKRGEKGAITFTFLEKPPDAGDKDAEGNKWQLGADGKQYGWIVTAKDTSKPKNWVHRYLLGWQTTCDGKNHQRVLFIDPETGKTELRGKR